MGSRKPLLAIVPQGIAGTHTNSSSPVKSDRDGLDEFAEFIADVATSHTRDKAKPPEVGRNHERDCAADGTTDETSDGDFLCFHEILQF